MKTNPATDKKKEFKGLRAMFLSGDVKKMKDIQDMYPTHIARSLGINHSRYIEKLYHPESFTIKHIWELALVLDIDVQLILEVIKTELVPAARGLRKKS